MPALQLGHPVVDGGGGGAEREGVWLVGLGGLGGAREKRLLLLRLLRRLLLVLLVLLLVLLPLPRGLFEGRPLDPLLPLLSSCQYLNE